MLMICRLRYVHLCDRLFANKAYCGLFSIKNMLLLLYFPVESKSNVCQTSESYKRMNC